MCRLYLKEDVVPGEGKTYEIAKELSTYDEFLGIRTAEDSFRAPYKNGKTLNYLDAAS